jgi:hypothetical protein
VNNVPPPFPLTGIWKAPGSKYDIQQCGDLLMYQEHTRTGATLTCPLDKKGEYYVGQLSQDFKIRFKQDGETLIKQIGSNNNWGKEIESEYCYDPSGSESEIDEPETTTSCALDDKECQDDMAWGREDTGRFKMKSSKKLIWQNPTQNHIWTKQELDHILQISTVQAPEHLPKTFGDKMMYHGVKSILYKGFNKLTGFKYDDPSPKACAWRILYLESIAGVPGMVSACLRHFRSLRCLQRDHGWIHTLLEEAENERMHLLIAMKMFNAGKLTRFAIIGGQYVFTTILVGVYAVHPQAVHRFVGYLEECAVDTYSQLIRVAEKDGTQLNKAWKDLPAPAIAKGYYRLDDNATWIDTVRCILADESHHRDVNHTFAGMQPDDPNPFIHRHAKDQHMAWTLNQPYERKGEYVTPSVKAKIDTLARSVNTTPA